VLLDGKVIIVSGVGPGLGREVAAAAVRDGASVVLGARRQANLEAAADEIDPSGKTVAWSVTDICDEAQCNALVAETVDRFGRVDGLVNVAALDSVMGGLEGADVEDWRRTLDTNVVGTLQMVRAAVPQLREAGGGSVVFIGSQTTFWPAPLAPQLIYGASKGALASAVWFLNRELGPSRIRVNTVVPTWMWGPPVEMFVDFMVQSGMSREDAMARITGPMPLGEIPSDGDVADAVTFFLSDRARMISGQTLFVNAGEFPH
jgi:NAD(P)-dependent dehydrogenase (short-subunit alcohol dehydrogenase family)